MLGHVDLKGQGHSKSSEVMLRSRDDLAAWWVSFDSASPEERNGAILEVLY